MTSDLKAVLQQAEAALRNHACHAGPSVPCARTPSECDYDCGEEAGDALLTVIEALKALDQNREAAVLGEMNTCSVAAPPPDHDPQHGGWRDIASAPRDGASLLAYAPGFGMGALVLFWLDGMWREPANHLGLKVEPTHWQPLPAPPAVTALSGGENKDLGLSQSHPSGAGPSDLAGPQSQHDDGEA